MSKAKVDICALGWNRSDVTRDFLQHLASNTTGIKYKLWFLDNGSDEPDDRTGNVMAWMKANTRWWVPWARYRWLPYKGYRSETNVGFSRGNNVLAKQGTAPWILFLNNDAFPTDDEWLKKLVDAAEHQGWDAIGPTSDYVMGIQDVRWDNDWPTLHPAKNLSGFCFLVRREVFEDLGGWDEQFLNGDEDCDMAIRIRKRAWSKERRVRPLGVHRGVFLRHLCSQSMVPWCKKRGESVQEHFQKTRILLCDKHGTRAQLDLFFWEDLRTPPHKWRELGVLPDGRYYQRPGDPVTAVRAHGRLDTGGRDGERICTGAQPARHRARRDEGVDIRREATHQRRGVEGVSVQETRDAGRVLRTKTQDVADDSLDVERQGVPAVSHPDKLHRSVARGLPEKEGRGEYGGPEHTRRPRGTASGDISPREPVGVSAGLTSYHFGASADGFYTGVSRDGQCPIRDPGYICGTCEAQAVSG